MSEHRSDTTPKDTEGRPARAKGRSPRRRALIGVGAVVAAAGLVTTFVYAANGGVANNPDAAAAPPAAVAAAANQGNQGDQGDQGKAQDDQGKAQGDQGKGNQGQNDQGNQGQGDQAVAEETTPVPAPTTDADLARKAEVEKKVKAKTTWDQASAEAAAKAAVEAYVVADSLSMQQPKGATEPSIELDSISDGAAAGEVENGLGEFVGLEYKQTGTAKVVSTSVVSVSKSNRTVVVKACVDSSDVQITDSVGNVLKAKASADSPRRYPTVYTVHVHKDHWSVTNFEMPAETC